MAPDSDQPTNEYEQLKETLELYPSIKLTKVEGNPPDNYEIEFHLKGYVRSPDSSIAIAELHRVLITLPFGYPHFPPTVKPLTHIFHPDIDPAAIRIAEHWQAKPNLSDLVLTIGEMICGNIYSNDDPFNQEASDWYEQHKGELPLDILQIADIDDSDERFDTLDDDTFSSLGLDDDDLFGEDAGAEADEGQIDLVLLQIEQKNFFAASQTLAEIPASANVTNREKLEQSIATALKGSDKLFKQVEQLEDQGKLDEAAKVIEDIENVAADTPGLDALRNRILQSQSLADSFSLETENEAEPPPPKEEKSKTTPPPAKNKVKKPSISAGSSLPLKSIIAGGVIGILLLVGGMIYFKDKTILTQGQEDWQKTLSLTKNRQFDDAQAEGESVLRNLQNLKILKSSGKVISSEINTLINSDDFQQGLLGNVLYNDTYVSFATAENIAELERLTRLAEDMVKQGKVRKSLPAYQTALNYARKHELSSHTGVLAQTINNLRFEDALASAKQAENEEEWENAAETYRRALELSRNLSDPEDAKDITKRLTTATFRHELNQSKQAFTGAQWQETITMLQHAQALIDENPTAVSTSERAELNQLLLNSRLYQMLTLAREAYEVRNWDKSINHYQAALHLLDTEKNNFGPGIEESYAKIEKTLLLMQIAREQGSAMQAKKEKKLNELVSHYNKILEMARQSKFREDEDVRKLSANIQEQRKGVKKQLALQSKINYLKDNYQQIFTKNYPSFGSSKLQHPKVKFIKKIGNRLLFTISCVERSQGSSSRLQLQYLYNPDNDRWSLYTGQ